MKTRLLILLLLLITVSTTSYGAVNPAHTYGCKIEEKLIAEKLQLIARHDKEKDGRMRETGIFQADTDEFFINLKKSKISGTVEGFILPGEKSVFTVPVINLSFTLNKNDIVYVCFHVDKDTKENNHLTLFFLEGKYLREGDWNLFNRKPVVKMSPATIEIQTIEGTVDTIEDIFTGVPVISMLITMFSNVIDFIMDGVHELLDHIIGIGVTKVVITGEQIELYYGLELLDQPIPLMSQRVAKPNPVLDGQFLEKDPE